MSDIKVIHTTNIDKTGKQRKVKNLSYGEGKDCVFPFLYNRKLQSECVDGKDGKWCATETDPNNKMKTWGFCKEKVNINKIENENDKAQLSEEKPDTSSTTSSVSSVSSVSSATSLSSSNKLSNLPNKLSDNHPDASIEDIDALNASDEESIENKNDDSSVEDEFGEVNELLATKSVDLLNDEGPTLVDDGDIIDDSTYSKFIYDYYDDKYKCRQCFTSDKIEKKTDLNGNIFINCYHCSYQLQVFKPQDIKLGEHIIKLDKEIQKIYSNLLSIKNSINFSGQIDEDIREDFEQNKNKYNELKDDYDKLNEISNNRKEAHKRKLYEIDALNEKLRQMYYNKDSKQEYIKLQKSIYDELRLLKNQEFSNLFYRINPARIIEKNKKKTAMVKTKIKKIGE